MSTDAIAKKIERLRAGHRPRVLDLFAGCGGFSLGFHRANAKIIGGVEIDKHAARSHALNFHGELQRSNPELFERHAAARDIRDLNPRDLIRELDHNRPAHTVDILVGGPPCPSFTRIGRAKLREIHEHPEAYRHDPRSKLYLPYLGFVHELQPLAVVMENVPDLMNFGGHNLAEEICDVLEEDGYRTAYTLLNAANYDVPEMRERFFLVGVHTDLGVNPIACLPMPTRKVDFPTGYLSARDVALQLLPSGESLFDELKPTRWVDTPLPVESTSSLKPAVTVSEAIGDLPPITAHLRGELKRGRRDLTTESGVPYVSDCAPSEWARTHMRNWPDFTQDPASDLLCGHVIRSVQTRDHRLFHLMHNGWQYPEVYDLALDLFASTVKRLRASDCIFPEEAEAVRRLHEPLGKIRSLLVTAIEDENRDALRAAAAAWQDMAGDLACAERTKRDFAAVLADLRRGTEHPWSPDIVRFPQSRWELIAADFAQSISSDQPVERATDTTLRRNRLVRLRRLREAYERGRQALRRQPDLPVRIDVDDTATAAASRKELLRLHDLAATNAAGHMWMTAAESMLLHVLEFSHDLGDAITLKRQFVPPYDPTKFPNKWRKMEADKPARTLMAHLGKDTYSHIHYDGNQARMISVREAARLQSFPDAFQFSGTMNPGFRQVGNAVPPLLSYALARALLSAMGVKDAAQQKTTSTDCGAMLAR